MPTDNALLPPTIHLSYLADDAIVTYLRRARESPGLSSAAAKELKERWYDLGPGAVQVVVEADADLCRIGYDDVDALRMIFEAGEELGPTVHQQSGIRRCILEIDGERIIFPPTSRRPYWATRFPSGGSKCRKECSKAGASSRGFCRCAPAHSNVGLFNV